MAVRIASHCESAPVFARIDFAGCEGVGIKVSGKSISKLTSPSVRVTEVEVDVVNDPAATEIYTV